MIKETEHTNLTLSSNLSYTARRAAGYGLQRAVKIYWIVKDAGIRRAAMKELGVHGMSVNGESFYNGSMDKLKEYVESGLIKIRVKNEQQR